MKEHDVYYPGVSEEQANRADKMLGSLSSATLVKTESSSVRYLPGVLMAPGQIDTPIKVMVSTAANQRPNEQELLAVAVIPELKYCQLVIQQGDSKTLLKGRVEASRPGQQVDNKQNKTMLNVARFYEQPARETAE